MRTGGRALVETTFSLDIRPLVRAGAIRDDVHVDGKMKFGPLDDDALAIAFEVSTLDRANRWIRVRCTVRNDWSGTRCDIDDPFSLTPSRAGFAGRKWWFICPDLGVRVRELYLPAGARHFQSRQAYNLAYETEHLDDRERAWRRRANVRAGFVRHMGRSAKSKERRCRAGGERKTIVEPIGGGVCEAGPARQSYPSWVIAASWRQRA